MLNSTLFVKQSINSYRLPLTIMYLDDWALVLVSGADTTKYLQSQLTLDITKIKKDTHYLAAHCNASGKMWSNLRIFYYGEYLAYIIRKEILEIQLIEIKKYSVFSEINFLSDHEFVLLGLAGLKAKELLGDIFKIIPNNQVSLVQNDETAILWFKDPIERFLIVTTNYICNFLKKTLINKVQFNNSQQWLSLDIEAGIPIIDLKNSGKFIPQDTNLHILNAISFTKGCYIGQEIIARAKYLNKHKYNLYWLTGRTKKLPLVNDPLEIKINQSWRRTGIVLAAVKLDNNLVSVQAVINKDICYNNVIRVLDDNDGFLNIQKTSYQL
ncbi:tRNA-modifying protein YgfZ [Candidatus Pantoea edessiphila]|uniref:tRNA-modifying protein YgfZ n=1 Tax=Candidatus Pantoea edessiphila TaxID=2044610 RepID=A0A2P5SVQ1_9GAMM|nr:tRNA-modifying protein YgfZ [Candidatus Pantoea edessiphila]PPI86409.1 tRNA-modifying protein YgfZ [Candidatus Pantoea edessiphila]